MVTQEHSVQVIDGVLMTDQTFKGLSTDDKPRPVANGSWYISIDKIGKKAADGSYENFINCYDAENDKWFPDEDEEGS